MSLKALQAHLVTAAAVLAVVGCAFSPTANYSDREGGYYYEVNYVVAVTFGASGNGIVWHNYGPDERSRAVGRLGDLAFTADGNLTRSAAAYAEGLGKTVVHIDSTQGTDFSLIFGGTYEGRVTGTVVSESGDVVALDATFEAGRAL